MKKLKPKAGIAVGVILLVLSYALGSRALDTGSYWEYLGCLVALIFSIKFIVRAIRNLKHGQKV